MQQLTLLSCPPSLKKVFFLKNWTDDSECKNPQPKIIGYFQCLLRKKGPKIRSCNNRQNIDVAKTFGATEHLHQREQKHSEELKVQEMFNDKAASTIEQSRIVQDLTTAAFFESAVPLRKCEFLGAEYPRTA